MNDIQPNLDWSGRGGREPVSTHDLASGCGVTFLSVSAVGEFLQLRCPTDEKPLHLGFALAIDWPPSVNSEVWVVSGAERHRQMSIALCPRALPPVNGDHGKIDLGPSGQETSLRVLPANMYFERV